MELTYTQCGDYLIPNLVLSDTKEYHIGKYGRMRRAYLKDHQGPWKSLKIWDSPGEKKS